MAFFAGNRIRRSWVISLAGLLATGMTLSLQAETPGAASEAANMASGAGAAGGQVTAAPCDLAPQGSPYIPLNFWLYPALTRLYSLGYLDPAFLGLRPWTRLSVVHMLENTSARLEDAPDTAGNEEARGIYDALMKELNIDAEGPCGKYRGEFRVE